MWHTKWLTLSPLDAAHQMVSHKTSQLRTIRECDGTNRQSGQFLLHKCAVRTLLRTPLVNTIIVLLTWSAVMVESSSLTLCDARAVRTLLRSPSFVSNGEPKRLDLKGRKPNVRWELQGVIWKKKVICMMEDRQTLRKTDDESASMYISSLRHLGQSLDLERIINSRAFSPGS